MTDGHGETVEALRPVTLVEVPPGWIDEQIEQFKQAWTGGPVEIVRPVNRVRVKVRWFSANGSLIDCQERTAHQGLELHMLLAAWSDRPLRAEIEIEPVEDDDA